VINHLAVIMDGNRRWAKSRGLLPWLGHQEGLKSASQVIDFCLNNSVKYLTLYTFSTENLKRPEIEKLFLFKIIADFALSNLIDLVNKDVKIRFIGQRSIFPNEILDVIENIEHKTVNGQKLLLNILFCYGGQQELSEMFKNYAQNNLTSDFNYQDLRKYSWLGDCPEPEIIIRTGGHKRLSNFMLAHCSYSEIYFLDDFWPDIKSDHLQSIFKQYQNVQRNFGA
jgi:undecaprenyl diphosphate synthase